MNSVEKYLRFELAKEMLQTPNIARNFRLDDVSRALQAIQASGKLFLTGEGSSRIFPAKNAIYSALTSGLDLQIVTEGGRQAAEYDLADYVVFAASNSGSTKEAISLLDQLTKSGHQNLFGLTAREETTSNALADCRKTKRGWEFSDIFGARAARLPRLQHPPD